MNHKVIIEPFRIKTVEKIKMTTEDERNQLIKNAHFNPFLLSAEDVIIDLLTDSGTSAMSAEQWGGILQGDESYAGARSWFKMKKAIQNLTGYEYIIPTHQGRAAEHLLYGRIGGKGKVFLSNTHFDTTRANIEYSGAKAIDIPIPEGLIPEVFHPFKGNMDIESLKRNIKIHGKENIAAVIITITNNSGGGQPVSLQNVREVSEICKENHILFIIDSCRIAENAYFVKMREKECENFSFKEIAQKMFSYADGTVMSAKKDALVNMGGFLALKNESMYNQLLTTLIITEGFATYGGLSGRDMEAIAIGLEEVFEHDYLNYRIRSTTYLGEKLLDMGISVISPIGGHAVYVDAKAFYPNIPVHQFPGQSLAVELYKLGGIRVVEIGSVMFGSKDDNGNFVPARMELVRLAIPRRVYTQSHIDYVVEVFDELRKQKKSAKGFKIVWEPEFLRHFTARFEPIS